MRALHAVARSAFFGSSDVFETGVNLWRQQLASPWLNALMLSISWLGYSAADGVLLLVLGFAVRLRPALLLMLVLLLTSAATHVIKDAAALPRPSDVDARVLDNTHPHQSLVAHGGATRFLALPSPAAVDALRRTDHPDFGFVSGHTSAAIALALALVLGFAVRRRWLRWSLFAWPLLMALSRLYLGRHFLADVLGGAALGALVAALVCLGLRKKTSARAPESRHPLLAVAMAMVLWLGMVASPAVSWTLCGEGLGLGLAWLALACRGFPTDAAAVPMRLLRLLCAMLVFAGFTGMAYVPVAMWPGLETGPARTLLLAAVLGAAVPCSVMVSQRLGFYRMRDA